MTHVRAAAVKNINSAADAKNKKEGEAMVELDQFKVSINQLRNTISGSEGFTLTWLTKSPGSVN